MLYVAYGSNMNLSQMEHRCPKSKVVGNAILKNYKLVFNYHADVKEFKGEDVPVVLWDIADTDWKMLDMYEGYPKYYDKRIVTVEKDGERIDAVVYEMTKYFKREECPPDYNYFKVIYDGYVENGIDTACLENSIKHFRNFSLEEIKDLKK